MAKGVEWCRGAADVDYLEAQIYLADMLQAGASIAGDPNETKAWFQRAADLGLPAARAKLDELSGKEAERPKGTCRES
jgi:TPR repeat protein